LARLGVTVPISSATSVKQADSLIRATELALSAGDMKALTDASAP
jgi:aryl-alcohol dehydrogenase-like predicted oxidoreductase